MDEPTNKPADSAASGEATPETSPPSGGEPAPPDFPVPRIGEDGKPIYDQEFFLALARRGKEAWNRWRAATPRVEGQPYISVTFEGVVFGESADAVINFSGFDFGDGANFRACKFVSRTFGDRIDFSGATFGDRTDLSAATFGDCADLSGATFGDRIDFSGATFGDGADLSAATFGRGASLSGATFGRGANLSDATFGPSTHYS